MLHEGNDKMTEKAPVLRDREDHGVGGIELKQQGAGRGHLLNLPILLRKAECKGTEAMQHEKNDVSLRSTAQQNDCVWCVRRGLQNHSHTRTHPQRDIYTCGMTRKCQ